MLFYNERHRLLCNSLCRRVETMKETRLIQNWFKLSMPCIWRHNWFMSFILKWLLKWFYSSLSVESQGLDAQINNYHALILVSQEFCQIVNHLLLQISSNYWFSLKVSIVFYAWTVASLVLIFDWHVCEIFRNFLQGHAEESTAFDADSTYFGWSSIRSISSSSYLWKGFTTL